IDGKVTVGSQGGTAGTNQITINLTQGTTGTGNNFGERGRTPETISIRDFFALFQTAPEKTPHTFAETVEKDHGRLEIRRCYAFDQLDCLAKPEVWPGLRSFAVIETERSSNGKVSIERRLYISSLAPDAQRLAQAIRSHWGIENRLHWCLDVAFADDQMRARTLHAAHNLAVLKRITMNLIRLDPIQRKGGIKARRLIAS
ncbi:MAG: ISAs1 family transposase, partial [Azovibrio sp.]|nr:ISAs1 family transposase [Azovibrio sp.]